MWRKEHGFSISLLWKISPWMTLIGIIGIIALSEPWRTASWLIFGLGIADLVFSLCFVFPYKKWRKDINIRDTRIAELAPLEGYKNSQLGHEQDWLHLVVEYIDLDKRMNTSDKQIWVKFNFDSGLLYEFKPYRMWVTPVLGGYVPGEAQHEIRQTPNYLPGKRSQESGMTITIKDDRLLVCVEDIRKGNKMSKALKVEMQSSPDRPIVSFVQEIQ